MIFVLGVGRDGSPVWPSVTKPERTPFVHSSILKTKVAKAIVTRTANTAVTNNQIKNASATARYYAMYNAHESGNFIGNPMYPAPLTAGTQA